MLLRISRGTLIKVKGMAAIGRAGGWDVRGLNIGGRTISHSMAGVVLCVPWR